MNTLVVTETGVAGSCYHMHDVMDFYFMVPFKLETQISCTNPAFMPWKLGIFRDRYSQGQPVI